ncbi:hypothetical protein [Sphingomonas echinoides]|uniref:hypothetical protein n=1 Tax=Sphingomonas echinoides TaxID=59803 RepID=UPI0024134A48|nr:hypothetical protein [Sphingomonas echinoides]
MRLLAILFRNRRDDLAAMSDQERALVEQQIAATARIERIRADIDANLQRRKASRAALNERARKGVETKMQAQVARDPLLREQVPF